MRERPDTGRRLTAIMAVLLFVLAQPRVFCAVHCLIFHGADDAMVEMSMPRAGQRLGAEGATRSSATDMACAHAGTTITSVPSIPAGSVGPATLVSMEFPAFGGGPAVAPTGHAYRAPTPVPPRVDTPPPRA